MIMNIDETADLLKMSTEGLRRKVVEGIIPGAKPGKCWIFIEEDILKYIREQYGVSTVNNKFHQFNKKKKGSTNKLSKSKANPGTQVNYRSLMKFNKVA